MYAKWLLCWCPLGYQYAASIRLFMTLREFKKPIIRSTASKGGTPRCLEVQKQKEW